MIPEDLKSYIEIEILPHYNHFDQAHRRDHVDTVIAASMKLARHYDVDIRCVYTIAAYHDMGLTEDRKTMHYERVRKHMKEKYAEGGYLKLWIPESDNAIRLKELRETIADDNKLKERFEILYQKIIEEKEQ